MTKFQNCHDDKYVIEAWQWLPLKIAQASELPELFQVLATSQMMLSGSLVEGGISSGFSILKIGDETRFVRDGDWLSIIHGGYLVIMTDEEITKEWTRLSLGD